MPYDLFLRIRSICMWVLGLWMVFVFPGRAHQAFYKFRPSDLAMINKILVKGEKWGNSRCFSFWALILILLLTYWSFFLQSNPKLPCQFFFSAATMFWSSQIYCKCRFILNVYLLWLYLFCSIILEALLVAWRWTIAFQRELVLNDS